MIPYFVRASATPNAAHFAAAEATGAAHTNAFGAELHRRSQRFLHCSAKRNATLELGGDVLRNELRGGFRFAHLLHIDENLIFGERLNAGEERLALGGSLQIAAFERFDAFASLTDDHSRARREDDDLALVGRSLDFDPGDSRVLQVFLDGTLDSNVFMKPFRVALVLEPLRVPSLDDSEAESVRVNFLTHSIAFLAPYLSPRMMVM